MSDTNEWDNEAREVDLLINEAEKDAKKLGIDIDKYVVISLRTRIIIERLRNKALKDEK